MIVTRKPADPAAFRAEFEKLFLNTQVLPDAADISDDDIEAEIEADRRSHEP